MKKFDKNFIYILIGGILIICFAIYFFTKDNTHEYTAFENMYLQPSEGVLENDISEIVVHITGEVLHPGIIYLPYGSRIIDAIEKAGGTTSNADISRVNLAYILQDSQKVYIPSVNDDQSINYVQSGAGLNVIESANNGIININFASQSELETLPGIGASTAAKIIDYRSKNGNFKSIEEITNVSGIGNSKFEIIKNYICV